MMDNSSRKVRSWTDNAIEEWISSGTKICPGLTLSEILSAESILDFKFPTDFIELYQKINGFRDLDWNEHMFSFWPLERIIAEYKTSEENNFIGFCDFLINSHSIGFVKNDSSIYKSYDRQKPIAATFQEVVTMINESSDCIY